MTARREWNHANQVSVAKRRPLPAGNPPLNLVGTRYNAYPIFRGQKWDAVERVPTRFRGMMCDQKGRGIHTLHSACRIS